MSEREIAERLFQLWYGLEALERVAKQTPDVVLDLLPFLVHEAKRLAQEAGKHDPGTLQG